MRETILSKDVSATARREHVKQFIETFDDRNLANIFFLLRLKDADEILTHQSANGKPTELIGSGKLRRQSAGPSILTPSKPARAVKVTNV